MAKYYPGYYEALDKVDTMDEKECLRTLNALFGTDNLKYGASIYEVRSEVREQLKKEFTKPEDWR